MNRFGRDAAPTLGRRGTSLRPGAPESRTASGATPLEQVIVRLMFAPGSSALESTTCRILRSRARYTPARDNNGMPVGYPVEDAVEWRLPGKDGERG